MPDAPHLWVCLVPDNVQDGDTAPLNVKRPFAILVLTPREVAPIVGVGSGATDGLPVRFDETGATKPLIRDRSF
jgi:hypothetical protein